MYDLPHHKEKDPAGILEFIRQHPFAMVIGVDADHQPAVTQVPMLVKERDGKLFLQAHVMRQTHHHKAFEHQPRVLAVFTGPHTYVSASWYVNKQIGSTWNYQAVHARGQLRFLESDQLLQLLKELTAHFENDAASPSLYEHLPAEYVQRMSKAIVGFEIEVTNIEHVYKLSQDRDEQSYQNIVDHLSAGDASARYIAEEMRKRKQSVFPEQNR